MNKKGKTNMWPIVVLVVAVLVLFYPNISNMIGGGEAPAEETTETDIGYVCPVDTTTLGFSLVDVDDPGTQLYQLARYWVEGLPQGEVNTSASVTVSPGDIVDVWFGSSSTTDYGSLEEDIEIPCKGTFDISGSFYTEDESVSITIYDEENDLAQTGAANNQTLGIGEQVEMRMRVKGNYETYYGNPEVSLDNVLLIEYDKSEIDEVTVIGPDGELAKSSVPLLEDAASGFTEMGFVFPKIEGSESVDYTLVINADDVENPSADMTIKIYDADFFYNSETGEIEEGWEDQSTNDIGAATEPTATVYLS